MPEYGQYGRNMSHVLAALIKRVVVYGNTYFKMIYHNGMDLTEKKRRGKFY